MGTPLPLQGPPPDHSLLLIRTAHPAAFLPGVNSRRTCSWTACQSAPCGREARPRSFSSSLLCPLNLYQEQLVHSRQVIRWLTLAMYVTWRCLFPMVAALLIEYHDARACMVLCTFCVLVRTCQPDPDRPSHVRRKISQLLFRLDLAKHHGLRM